MTNTESIQDSYHKDSYLKALRPPITLPCVSPDHVIPPSGPGLVSGLPEPLLYPEAPGDKDRRCSVISGNMTKPITNFPLRNTKGARDKLGDIRRPSDLWQGRRIDDFLCALQQSQFNASVVLGKDIVNLLSIKKEYSRVVKGRNVHNNDNVSTIMKQSI